MATSYGLDLTRALRSLRQRKAAGGYVPQSFINDILEANINTAAGNARSERALDLSEQAQKTSAENAARSLALSEANAATQKEQYATSLAEQQRQADLNRALTEEQIANAGKSSIASMVTQLPVSVLAGKQAYDWITKKTPGTATETLNDLPPSATIEPTTPTSTTASNASTIAGVGAEAPTSIENYPDWLKPRADDTLKPLDRMFGEPTGATPEMYEMGTPSMDTSIPGAAVESSPVTTGAEVGTGTTSGAAEVGGATIGGVLGTAAPYVAAARIGMPILGGILEKYSPGEEGSSNVFQQGARITGEDYMRPIEAVTETAFGVETPEIIDVAFNPGGYLMNKISGGGTWLCTAADKHIGVTKEEKKALRKLRRYVKKNHGGWLQAYFINGPELIDAIEDQEADLYKFYLTLKKGLVDTVVGMIEKDCMEDAFGFYKAITIELFQKYTPNIEIKEASGRVR